MVRHHKQTDERKEVLRINPSDERLWIHKSASFPITLNCQGLMAFNIIEAASHWVDGVVSCFLWRRSQIKDHCYHFQLGYIDSFDSFFPLSRSVSGHVN